MSSQSLSAARARRAGENKPPISGNRPVTSIGSHAAFAQQMPPGMGYNMPPPPNNVRVAKAIQPPQRQMQQQQQQQQRQAPPQQRQPPQQSYQHHQQQYEEPPSVQPLPFNKLSISDAIGLITLRLGRVEQWIIDTEHETTTPSADAAVPNGHTIIDNAVFTTMIHRLDSLEKTGVGSNKSEDIAKLIEDVKLLSDQFKRMSDDLNRQNIELAKNTEQVFKFNRELVETKDILKSFMVKYDMFTEEISARLSDHELNMSDYEVALSDLESKILVKETIGEGEGVVSTSIDQLQVDHVQVENIRIQLDDKSELINSIKEELLKE